MAKGQVQDFSTFWLIITLSNQKSAITTWLLVEVAISFTFTYSIQLVTEIKRNNAVLYHKYLILVNKILRNQRQYGWSLQVEGYEHR